MTASNPLDLGRRDFVALLAAMAAASSAHAQSPAQAVQTYGVFVMVGDGLEMVVASPPAASRVDRGGRENQLIPGSGFDRAAMLAARDALRRAQPIAFQHIYRASATLDADQQREVLATAQRGEWLPWMQTAIERDRVTRMVLVTRERGDAYLRTKTGDLGTGSVDGVGYYVDRHTPVIAEDGRSLIGFLAPFVYLRVTEFDIATRRELRSESIRATATLGISDRVAGRDPWDAQTNVQKIETLRAMLREHVEGAVYRLVAPP